MEMSKLYICGWRFFLSSGEGYEVTGLTENTFGVVFTIDCWDKDE